MQIKCPGCAKVLSIPESAAGKVVKCPCGKQLRAPGGPAQPASGAQPQRPAPQRPAQPRPAQPAQPRPAQPAQRPAAPAQPAAPAAGGFGNDLFDELTDTDLSPVKAVTRPGQKQSTRGGSQAALDEAGGGSGGGGGRRSFMVVAANMTLGIAAIGIGGGVIYWDQTREQEEDEGGIRIRRRKTPTGIGIGVIVLGIGWMGNAIFGGGDDEGGGSKVASKAKPDGKPAFLTARKIGYGVLFLSVLFLASAIKLAFFSEPEEGADTARNVGMMVGWFLPFVLTLATGIFLVTKKPKKKK